MNKLVVIVVFSFIIFLGCASITFEDKKNPFLGAWNIEEVHWITPDTTYSINKAQPGIFMVTPERYSSIWTPTYEPRISFIKLAYPTDSERIAGFNSIVFNSGSYTIEDTLFYVVANIAKVPGFEGGRQTFEYKFYEDSIEL